MTSFFAFTVNIVVLVIFSYIVWMCIKHLGLFMHEAKQDQLARESARERASFAQHPSTHRRSKVLAASAASTAKQPNEDDPDWLVYCSKLPKDKLD